MTKQIATLLLISYVFLDLLRLQEVANLSEQFFLRGTLWSLWSWLFLLLHLIHSLDHQEDTESDDDEVNNVLDERTVGKYRCASLLSLGQCLVLHVVRQVDEEVGEIDTTSTKTDNRHQHVIYQTSHNLTEGTADDDTDCHVHYVAFHGKLFELFNTINQ